MEDLKGELWAATARPGDSVEPRVNSVLLFVLQVGGKQPRTRRVTFQHSGLSN